MSKITPVIDITIKRTVTGTELTLTYNADAECDLLPLDDFAKKFIKTQLKKAIEDQVIQDAMDVVINNYQITGFLSGIPVHVHSLIPKDVVFLAPETFAELLKKHVVSV